VWRPKNVLCATALHPDSARTAAYAYVLARQFGAQFTLLNVNAEQDRTDAGDGEAFAHAFERHLPADMGPQPPLQSLLSGQNPGVEITAYASKHAVDLVVMGAHTAPALATHFAQGTTSHVFAEAPCPVMTLRDS
jgi:nucleotide-binding universal stress UspA family protein